MPAAQITRRRYAINGHSSQDPGGGGGGGDATVVSAVIQRFDGGSGALQPWGFLPFSEADNISTSDLANVRVFVGATEQQLGIAYPRGRYNNGGLVGCVYRLESRTVPDASAVTAEIWYGGSTARQTTDITFTAPSSSEVLAGTPLCVPDDPDYLCGTTFAFDPLIPYTQFSSAETAKFVTWKESHDATWDAMRLDPAGEGLVGGEITVLGQGAFYPTCRFYMNSWMTRGNVYDCHRALWMGQYMYNLGTGIGETTGMIKQDYAIMHNATTQTGFWTEVKDIANFVQGSGTDGGGGLSLTSQAAFMAVFPSRTYGFRFTVRSMFSALGAMRCDGKATGGPTFATRFPWVIDSLEAIVWGASGKSCIDGITGCDPAATEGSNVMPVFQVTVTNAFYRDYFRLVQADSRIPDLIKANCDAYLTQFLAYNGSNGEFDNNAYAAGATHGWRGANVMICPMTGNVESVLSHMCAADLAFTYAYTGNTTYKTWYERVINPGNVVSADLGSNRLKILGEMGWAWSGPYYRKLGDDAGTLTGPSSIREPTSY